MPGHKRALAVLLREEVLFALVASSPTVPLAVQLMGRNFHTQSTPIICERLKNPSASNPLIMRLGIRDYWMGPLS
jgi:hypothetical protein